MFDWECEMVIPGLLRIIISDSNRKMIVFVAHMRYGLTHQVTLLIRFEYGTFIGGDHETDA